MSGVAVDARALCGDRSGIGVFTAALVERWVAAGRPVRLLAAAGSDTRQLDTRRLDTRLGGDVAAAVTTLPAPFHLRAAALARREGLRYFSPDSLIVPALLGARATVTVHDLAPLLHPRTHTLRVRVAYRLLLRLGTRRAGRVVVPSAATAADLRRHSPHATVVVVPEGPRALPPPGPLPAGVRAPYLLYAASLEPRKHPVELVEAFLAAAPQPWQLVVAGGRRWLDAGDWRRLQELAGSPRVHLPGFVDDAVLSGLLAGAGALAYPSSYEGFGLPVLEAMAAGVPVLATTAAALVELTAGAALLVDLDAPDPYGAGLRDATARLLGDEALRERLAALGRVRAAAFSWDAAADLVWQAVTEPR